MRSKMEDRANSRTRFGLFLILGGTPIEVILLALIAYWIRMDADDIFVRLFLGLAIVTTISDLMLISALPRAFRISGVSAAAYGDYAGTFLYLYRLSFTHYVMAILSFLCLFMVFLVPYNLADWHLLVALILLAILSGIAGLAFYELVTDYHSYPRRIGEEQARFAHFHVRKEKDKNIRS